MEPLMQLKTSIRRRFEFIEFCLQWSGKIGRPQLQEQFSISPQQATNDLTTYSDAYPDNITYDLRERSYVTAEGFSPKLIKGEASEYLMHLEMLAKNYRNEEEIWVNPVPNFDIVSVSSRQLVSKTVKTVITAINRRQGLKAKYFSLSSANESERTLIPHALASDGHRWHMRAFHVEKKRFGDFVLSRLKDVSLHDISGLIVPEDESWDTIVDVGFEADSNELDNRQCHTLEFEYGMEDGCLNIKVRQAMLFYLLRHYGFNPHERKNDVLINKSSFHLKIKNLERVEQCLGRRN